MKKDNFTTVQISKEIKKQIDEIKDKTGLSINVITEKVFTLGLPKLKEKIKNF